MTSTTTTFETGDGVSIFVRHWPAQDPIAKVLIVHGLGEHSGRYEHVGEAFAAAGLDTSAIDLHGHGRSDGRKMHVDTFDQYLTQVEHSLARLKGDVPVVLFGHSMGGLVALSYALSGRDRPEILVLSAPLLEAGVPKALKVAATVLGKVVPKAMLPSSIKGHQLSKDSSVGEAYFADPLVGTKASASLGSALLKQMEQVRPLVDRLGVPTYVYHGGDDELVPTAGSEILQSVPGVERRVYHGLRHEMHNEPEQDAVINDVIEWIKGKLAALDS